MIKLLPINLLLIVYTINQVTVSSLLGSLQWDQESIGVAVKRHTDVQNSEGGSPLPLKFSGFQYALKQSP